MDFERFFSSFHEDGRGSDDVSMVSVETRAKDHCVAGDCIGNALVELGAMTHRKLATGSCTPPLRVHGGEEKDTVLHVYIQTYIHTYIQICVPTYNQANRQTFSRYTQTHIQKYVQVCMHVCKYILADEHRVRE